MTRVVEVRPVRGRRDVTAFAAAPWHVRQDDPVWVPQLRRSMRRGMSPKHNPFHREAHIEHFVVRASRRGIQGPVLGRVAATIHPAYVDKYGPRAFFGLFESVPDERVASELLGAVEGWAADRGMPVVAGPYGYTATQEIGLLVDGFDDPPALMQPHNPAYYADLLRACGYQPAFEMTSYSWRAGERADIEDRLLAAGDKLVARLGLHVRTVDMSRYEEELESLRRVYNRSFADHPELVPISRQVFGVQAADLRPVIDPDLVRVVEKDGQPVGFALLVPDLNEILRGGSGRITPGVMLRLLARRDYHVRGIRSAVVVMVGAAPEYVGKGLGRVIAAELIRIARAGRYATIDTTWVHEQNRWCRALVGQLRSVPVKRYAVFERAL